MPQDRITANLPSRNFGKTEDFYAALGFVTRFRDAGWMILTRGPLELEFFLHPKLDPRESWFGACIRVADLDALYAAFQSAALPATPTAIPRLTAPHREAFGRMFALVDLDGNLLRCLDV